MKRTPLTRKARIRPVSKRRQQEQGRYSRAREEFLRDEPRCLACVRIYERTDGQFGNNPPLPSTEVHHMKGRAGFLYLDVEYWMPICWGCHKFAHDQTGKAIEFGISLRRNET